MEQAIKIGNLNLANLTEEKESELLAALQKRFADREAGREWVVVRADRAGVFFGIPRQIANGMVILDKCRRLWYWDGAASLSQMARDGADKSGCKFSARTDGHCIMGVIEIVPCTAIAASKINAVKEWVV